MEKVIVIWHISYCILSLQGHVWFLFSFKIDLENNF